MLNVRFILNLKKIKKEKEKRDRYCRGRIKCRKQLKSRTDELKV